MKKSMKRTLMGTALAGAVIIGAGAGVGTFSDFTDTAASTGNTITTGTLSLGDNSGNALLNLQNLKPGDKQDGQDIVIKNVGSLDGKLTFDLSSLNLAIPNNPSNEELKDIQIKLNIKKNGASLRAVTLPASAFTSSNEAGIEKAINNTFKNVVIAPEDEVVISGSVDFKRQTHDQNNLQAVNITGDLSWTLTQN